MKPLSNSTHTSELKCPTDIEHQLDISSNIFRLVAILLGNSTHWCGISLIHGKYLLYDGMFKGNRLRWVAPSLPFSTLGQGDFKVGGLWYKYCPIERSQAMDSFGAVLSDEKTFCSSATGSTDDISDRHLLQPHRHLPKECLLTERDDENSEVTDANDDISEGGNETVPRPSGQGDNSPNNSGDDVACLPKQKHTKQKKDNKTKKGKTIRYRMGVSIAPVKKGI